MTVETFNPNKVANKTTTLETPVKVLSEGKQSTASTGNRIGFVSLGCPKNLVDSERILTQLRTEGYDAIVLAKAGVDRLELDLSDFHVEVLNPNEFVPAPAQGVLGLQIREGDQEMFDILQKMNHPQVQKRIGVERKVLNLLEGGCQLPLGVYCNEQNELYVSFASNDSSSRIFHKYNVESFDGMAEKVVNDLTVS